MDSETITLNLKIKFLYKIIPDHHILTDIIIEDDNSDIGIKDADVKNPEVKDDVPDLVEPNGEKKSHIIKSIQKVLDTTSEHPDPLKIIIPSNITIIGEKILSSDSDFVPSLIINNGPNLDLEIISKSVIKINDKAFDSCNKLVSVNFPNVRKCGDNIFYMCENLKYVNLPRVRSFGKAAFYGCTSLESIYLPNVRSFGIGAFGGCWSLKYVNLPKVKSFDNIKSSTPVVSGNGSFNGCSVLESIDLPKVESFGDEAFGDCVGLKYANFPKVKSFGNSAFTGCALESIDLSNVEKLGSNALSSCDNLKIVILSDKILSDIPPSDIPPSDIPPLDNSEEQPTNIGNILNDNIRYYVLHYKSDTTMNIKDLNYNFERYILNTYKLNPSSEEYLPTTIIYINNNIDHDCFDYKSFDNDSKRRLIIDRSKLKAYGNYNPILKIDNLVFYNKDIMTNTKQDIMTNTKQDSMFEINLVPVNLDMDSKKDIVQTKIVQANLIIYDINDENQKKLIIESNKSERPFCENFRYYWNYLYYLFNKYIYSRI